MQAVGRESGPVSDQWSYLQDMRKAAANPALELVSLDTLNERIYKELRRALMSGAFDPGQKLSIRALAASLGTSAMPVRDALRRLITERALDGLPNKSITVPIVNSEQLDEIYKIRIVLESLAAAEAARKITRGQIDDLRKTERSALAAFNKGNAKRFADLNWRFHFAIYEASGMPQLVSTIEAFWLQVGPLLSKHQPRLHAQIVTQDHGKVIDALEAADSEAASSSIAVVLNHTWQSLADILREAEPSG